MSYARAHEHTPASAQEPIHMAVYTHGNILTLIQLWHPAYSIQEHHSADSMRLYGQPLANRMRQVTH